MFEKSLACRTSMCYNSNMRTVEQLSEVCDDSTRTGVAHGRRHAVGRRAAGRGAAGRGAADPRIAVCTGSHRRAWRLTPRGRVVIAALITIALSVLIPLRAEAGAGAQTTWAPHIVQPGDTLWSLVHEIDPSADPRGLMAQVREVNGLTSAHLAAGQTLLLPPTAP